MTAGSAVWSILIVLLLSCRPEAPPNVYLPENMFLAGASERTYHHPAFDTLWMYGHGDSVLASASKIESFSNGDAAVLDIVGQRVHRIGQHGVLWSWGRRGAGPKELGRVRAFAVDDGDRVVLGDSGNRRVILISPSGEWINEARFPQVLEGRRDWGPGTINSVAAVSVGSYLLARGGPHPWILVTEDGAGSSLLSSPWEGFWRMHPMQTMGEVATGPQHTAFGFSFGNGFFVWSGTDSIRSYPYVEHADFPTVVRTQLGPGQVGHSWLRRPDQSAQDIAIRGDTLIVLVRNWILDML